MFVGNSGINLTCHDTFDVLSVANLFGWIPDVYLSFFVRPWHPQFLYTKNSDIFTMYISKPKGWYFEENNYMLKFPYLMAASDVSKSPAFQSSNKADK